MKPRELPAGPVVRTVLSLPRAGTQFLVRKLRSYKLCGTAQKNKVKPNITTDCLIMTYQRSFTNCNILVCDVDGGSSYVEEGRRYTDGHSVFSV